MGVAVGDGGSRLTRSIELNMSSVVSVEVLLVVGVSCELAFKRYSANSGCVAFSWLSSICIDYFKTKIND